jgi:hypothetical protein
METCYTREQIEKTVISKGYKWFTDSKDKGYDVNIVGVRNSSTNNEVTNKFDDCITVSYKINSAWKFHCYEATTDPGKHWVENIMNKHGVAILKPGQYRSSHKIRLHGGRYEALGQQKPVKVYRDKNLDGKYDLSEENVMEGLYGINIHRATKYAGKKSTQIDKWSAGCQVIAANDNWTEFMKIMRKARNIWGNSFTYTLIESKDIV